MDSKWWKHSLTPYPFHIMETAQWKVVEKWIRGCTHKMCVNEQIRAITVMKGLHLWPNYDQAGENPSSALNGILHARTRPWKRDQGNLKVILVTLTLLVKSNL